MAESSVTEMAPVPNMPGIYARRDGAILERKGDSYVELHLRKWGGYLGFTSNRKWKHVHVAVLEAFAGPRPDGFDCCHWNDNRLDNRIENLRWASHRDNIQDAIRNGRMRCHGEENRAAILTAMQVQEIKRKYRNGMLQRELAGEYGVSLSTISGVVRGATWNRDKPYRKQYKKLSVEEVIAIKAMLAVGNLSHGKIAKQFGVSRCSVQEISTGRSHAKVVA
jgi:hypothetical protein